MGGDEEEEVAAAVAGGGGGGRLVLAAGRVSILHYVRYGGARTAANRVRSSVNEAQYFPQASSITCFATKHMGPDNPP